MNGKLRWEAIRFELTRVVSKPGLLVISSVVLVANTILMALTDLALGRDRAAPPDGVADHVRAPNRNVQLVQEAMVADPVGQHVLGPGDPLRPDIIGTAHADIAADRKSASA